MKSEVLQSNRAPQLQVRFLLGKPIESKAAPSARPSHCDGVFADPSHPSAGTDSGRGLGSRQDHSRTLIVDREGRWINQLAG